MDLPQHSQARINKTSNMSNNIVYIWKIFEIVCITSELLANPFAKAYTYRLKFNRIHLNDT